jgi:hypothetical protein
MKGKKKQQHLQIHCGNNAPKMWQLNRQPYHAQHTSSRPITEVKQH